MNLTRKGLLLAALQLLIVLSLGAKLLYDRATRPRVWAQADNFDPDLPMRGRYLALRPRVIPEGFSYKPPSQPNVGDWWSNQYWGYLSVRNHQLVASTEGSGSGMWIHVQKNPSGELTALAGEPVLVFIPETFQMPTTHPGDQLWVELTLPAKGPPRPIRLAIKNASGFTPLHFN
jgi:hypothetical protein